MTGLTLKIQQEKLGILKVNFENTAREIGNIIYGSKTYEIGIEEGTMPFKGIKNIVMSSDDFETEDDVEVMDESPENVLDYLESEGFEQALIAGGSRVNTSFLEEGLVDEIILTLHPNMLGTGKNFLTESNLKLDLELIEVDDTYKDFLKLKYKVIKE